MAFQFFVPGVTKPPNLLAISCSNGANGTDTMNSAAMRRGIVFRKPSGAGDLTGFRVSFGSPAGTVTNIGELEVYAIDSNGAPTGSALGTITFTPALGYSTLSFGSPLNSLTDGESYAAFYRNTDGSPGSNNWRSITGGHSADVGYRLQSNDSGSTWTVSIGNAVSIAPIWSTAGTIIPSFSEGTNSQHATQFYNASGSRKTRIGAELNFPCSWKLWAISISFSGNQGSPTYDVLAELCDASSVLDTASNIRSGIGSTANVQWFFDDPPTNDPGTPYYAIVTPDGANAGDSSNRYRPAAGGVNTSPFTYGPMIAMVESTGTGISFSRVTGNVMLTATFYVELIDPSGGGGGIFTQRGLGAGLN